MKDPEKRVVLITTADGVVHSVQIEEMAEIVEAPVPGGWVGHLP